MKVLRLAAPVLALALLAGCQQPAVESPSPVPSPDAVSYTHLDVYKRQSMMFMVAPTVTTSR